MPQFETARLGSEELDSALPRCFRKIPDVESKRLAVEIYDALKTVRNVLPSPIRGEGANVCPVKQLGIRNARFILSEAMAGRRFAAQDYYETCKVKFVGSAAAMLEAVRLGAASVREQEMFFSRVKRVVLMVANPQFVTMRQKFIGPDLLMRVYGIPASGVGKLSIEKWLGLWIWVNRNQGIARIEAIRVTDDDLRPEIY